MVGVIIIIMVVFDAQAAGRAAARAFFRPAGAKAKVIAATYSSSPTAGATHWAAGRPLSVHSGGSFGAGRKPVAALSASCARP